LSWNQWYFNGTIRAINQGLGRLIRHIKDYGQLFLMDERYTELKFKKGLPSWATSKDLDVWETFEAEKLSTIDKFYRDNMAMFPPELK
jgi:Rad3-related DNA helicase